MVSSMFRFKTLCPPPACRSGWRHVVSRVCSTAPKMNFECLLQSSLGCPVIALGLNSLDVPSLAGNTSSQCAVSSVKALIIAIGRLDLKWCVVQCSAKSLLCHPVILFCSCLMLPHHKVHFDVNFSITDIFHHCHCSKHIIFATWHPVLLSIWMVSSRDLFIHHYHCITAVQQFTDTGYKWSSTDR